MRVEVFSFRLYGNWHGNDAYVQIADRINGMNPRKITLKSRTGKLPSFNFYSWGNELSIYVVGYNIGFNRFLANYTIVPAGENKFSTREIKHRFLRQIKRRQPKLTSRESEVLIISGK